MKLEFYTGNDPAVEDRYNNPSGELSDEEMVGELISMTNYTEN